MTRNTAALDISFDRIARQYDGQRAHPPEVSAQIGAEIAAIVGGGPVLELGVGTGRIARPVAAAGLRVISVDLALEMLRVARQRGADELLQADVVRLPLRSGSCAAVLAVHVLHLVADWRAALREALRVLQPGGALIQGHDWRDPQSCAELLRGRLRMAVMELAPAARPPSAGAAIDVALRELGATSADEIVAASWSSQLSPAAVLDGMARRADAETWALPDDLLTAAVAQVRAWAAVTWDDLDAAQPVDQRFVLTVTRGRWQPA